jgi:hypothetical protein
MHCVASEAARTLKVTEDGMVQMLDTRVDDLVSVPTTTGSTLLKRPSMRSVVLLRLLLQSSFSLGDERMTETWLPSSP